MSITNITYRNVKGSAITATENDTNLSELAKATEGELAANIASAATTVIGVYGAGNTVTITGTTTITSLGVSTTGTIRKVVFAGALTLTYNATSLLLPGNASITTVADDTAEFVCFNGALGYWRCTSYTRRAGLMVDAASTQTISGAKTFSGTTAISGAATLSGTTTTISSATTTLSGGTQNLGSSTGATTISVGGGATTAATTKTIDIGTAGVSTSITNINIGSAVAGATGTTRLNSNTILTGIIAGRGAAPTIASAATIAPTTMVSFVSGTTAIATITAPAPISTNGGRITIIPTGIFTTTTAGNIALASTAVVNRALTFTYDPTTTKWYPSY